MLYNLLLLVFKMSGLLQITFICVFLALAVASPVPVHDENDIGLNITQLVRKYGYPIEEYEVQTDDGFILALHRIPHGASKHNTDTKRPVVLLMPGLLSSSIDWVNSGPENGLGFLLADRGYDVWLGNQRGSTLCKKHATLDPGKNASKFWDFSFHEIGTYDVAAKIDFVLKATGQSQLTYIGHSQGNTALYALLASKPSYNAAIKLAVAFGPVVYLNHSTHPILKLLASKLTLIDIGARIAGIHEIAAHLKIFTELAKDLCEDGSELQVVCADIIYMFGGFDTNLNTTLIPIIASNDPAGASVKQLLHYVQMHISGLFRQYDYGFVGNLQKYGKMQPPEYDLNSITAPMVLYSAPKDWFNAPEDVQTLAKQLPNVVDKLTVSEVKFSHIDFLWGRNVRNEVYQNVFAVLDNYY